MADATRLPNRYATETANGVARANAFIGDVVVACTNLSSWETARTGLN